MWKRCPINSSLDRRGAQHKDPKPLACGSQERVTQEERQAYPWAEHLDQTLKHLWADHGDAISLQALPQSSGGGSCMFLDSGNV